MVGRNAGEWRRTLNRVGSPPVALAWVTMDEAHIDEAPGSLLAWGLRHVPGRGHSQDAPRADATPTRHGKTERRNLE
jgi:hypothetical protein